MSIELKIPKKLIEVALPLDAINVAAAKEKQPGIGAHPRGLHLWWARRPLAAARAVIFAQMVNDPGYERDHGRGVNKEKAQNERQRIFSILERLVRWENIDNTEVIQEARDEILKSWKETCEQNKGYPGASLYFNPEKLPRFLDPFAGGGAIPLEAQRLGLEVLASDLNPVAVLINKAMIEVPHTFAGRAPVNPQSSSDSESSLLAHTWQAVQGLAADIRYYGRWIQSEAERRIGHLYPPVTITKEMATGREDLEPLIGKQVKVLTWIWVRTVKSPNPAYSHVHVPLASTFMLATKDGKQAYVEPIFTNGQYQFTVKLGKPVDGEKAKQGTSAGKWNAYRCLMSGVPISYDYVRAEGIAGRLGLRMMAVIAEGIRGKLYLPPSKKYEDEARSAAPAWGPELDISFHPRDIKTQIYGLTKYRDLFTPRQLESLNTFSDLVIASRDLIKCDAVAVGFSDDGIPLAAGGSGATAYAEAVSIYLAFAVDRLVDYNSSLTTWKPSGEQVMQTFKRQSLPMTWDFPESNPLGQKAICWANAVEYSAENLEATFRCGTRLSGKALQRDAQSLPNHDLKAIVSTDPPYYDNIGYADLSDFFYVWLKRTLGNVFPDLFEKDQTPKPSELVANPYRHGSEERAQEHFLNGMMSAMQQLRRISHPAFPLTIYYAFKQSETENEEGTSSTGWDTFLQAILSAGFSITGTWPMRTELSNRMMGSEKNALASSVVLVCRTRPENAPTISRREFKRELDSTMPEALLEMTAGGEHSPVAPVDLSQAIIGPGMAIFSKYSAVLEADGNPMTVRTALQLINRFLAEEDFDHDSQFCTHWFDGHGWDKGKFGDADVLARAKGTSVEGLGTGGIIESSAGYLRLLKPKELSDRWTPEAASRISVWEILHHMIRRLNLDGESGAGEILGKTSHYSENIRTLAYRLYTLCERKGWAQDAVQYNALVLAWDAIETSARNSGYSGAQISLFGEGQRVGQTENADPKKKARKKK